MSKTVDDQKLAIEQKMEKLRMQAKLLKNKEERKKAKRFTNIGRIASRAGIEELDDKVLLGAFLEIKERSGDESVVASWKERAGVRNKEDQAKENTPITVSFQNVPDKETKDLMKNLGFKWNSFRQEYYGYGCVETLRKKLSTADCKIDTIN